MLHCMKRFFEWIGLKEKLHEAKHQPPLVSERDMWWASLFSLRAFVDTQPMAASSRELREPPFLRNASVKPAAVGSDGKPLRGAAKNSFMAKCVREQG